MEISQWLHAPWNKGLSKSKNFKIVSMSKSQSIARIKGLKEGTIKVWNKGLTKESDSRVKLSGQKQSRTKLIKTGGNRRWHYNEARRIMGIRDKDLCVHHIDMNPFNNKKENLCVVTRAEHVRIHLPRKGKNKNVIGGNKNNVKHIN